MMLSERYRKTSYIFEQCWKVHGQFTALLVKWVGAGFQEAPNLHRHGISTSHINKESSRSECYLPEASWNRWKCTGIVDSFYFLVHLEIISMMISCSMVLGRCYCIPIQKRKKWHMDLWCFIEKISYISHHCWSVFLQQNIRNLFNKQQLSCQKSNLMTTCAQVRLALTGANSSTTVLTNSTVKYNYSCIKYLLGSTHLQVVFLFPSITMLSVTLGLRGRVYYPFCGYSDIHSLYYHDIIRNLLSLMDE